MKTLEIPFLDLISRLLADGKNEAAFVIAEGYLIKDTEEAKNNHQKLLGFIKNFKVEEVEKYEKSQTDDQVL